MWWRVMSETRWPSFQKFYNRLKFVVRKIFDDIPCDPKNLFVRQLLQSAHHIQILARKGLVRAAGVEAVALAYGREVVCLGRIKGSSDEMPELRSHVSWRPTPTFIGRNRM